MESTHCAVRVNCSFSAIYDLTLNGVSEADPDIYLKSEEINHILKIECSDKEGLEFIKEACARIEAAVCLDLCGDWVDLLRLFFGKRMINHNCSSFVWYVLGFSKDPTVYSPDTLYSKLKEML